MPNPKTLKVDDLVQFVGLPESWSLPGIGVHADSRRFMKKLIRRSWPSRIYKVDSDGYPWIRAVIHERGRRHYHSWMITESTGWRLVKRRTP